MRAAGAPLALAGVYVLLARLGLSLATVGKSVTLVWPPTGVALAALLIGGGRLWWGVALGAFVVNAVTPGVPLAVAAAMAAGNTAEALLGAWASRRAGVQPALGRVRDVCVFVAVAAVGSTVVSATVGTAALALGGVIPVGTGLHAWRVWWTGDLMSDLVLAPAALCWASRPRPGRPSWPRAAEGAALAVALVATCALMFWTRPGATALDYVGPYAVFPLLIWAAMRFGPRGAATATLAVTSVSVLGTARGLGDFARGSLDPSLLASQTFMAVAALTSMVLGAASAERSYAIRLREEFISIASHELNTPITALTLQVQRLARAAARDGTAALGPALPRLEGQVMRLGRLIADLLDVTRLGAGALALETADTDLAAVVRDAVDGVREELARAGCPVEVREHGPARGRWDQRRLQQVMTNLLVNAAKYGPGAPIRIDVAVEDGRAVVRVTDAGPGIEPGDRARIFERFERGHAPGGTSGLGLGLYIARRVVESHGGRIAVEGVRGRGATFVVDLPIASAAQR